MTGSGPPDDDFDAAPTRKRRTPIEVRPPTEAERREHARVYARGVPVVAEMPSRRQLQTAEQRDTESERQRQLRIRLRTTPYGVPAHRADEITGEHEVFDRPPRADELEWARRSTRDVDSPLTLIDGRKLLSHLEKIVAKRLDESAERERKRQAADVAAIQNLIANPPHAAVQQLQADVVALKADRLADRHATLEIRAELDDSGKEPGLRTKVGKFWDTRRMVIGALCAVALPAIGGLSIGLSALLTRTEAETKTQMRLERALDEIEALKAELGQYRRLVIPSP